MSPCRSLFIAPRNVLQFPLHRFCTYFVKHSSKYFMYLDSKINGTIPFYHFPVIRCLYINTNDLLLIILTLYPIIINSLANKLTY